MRKVTIHIYPLGRNITTGKMAKVQKLFAFDAKKGHFLETTRIRTYPNAKGLRIETIPMK
jgi:hypothetical protein